MAYLTIRIKNEDGHLRADLSAERNVVGRSSSTQVPIKHTSISREHCAFVREGETWFIEDLGSSNGTWLNKTKVSGRAELTERDIVKAGQARMTFHAGARDAAEPEAAVDLTFDDDDGQAKGPIRTVGGDDPREAVPCSACNAWFSVAHRLAGERMACPRCGHENAVPSMNA